MKNRPRTKQSGNRYMRYAKMSEYSFLKILRGFADDKPAYEYDAGFRISEKSIRAIYRKLRSQLMIAALENPLEFGGAGFFLFESDSLSERGKHFISEVIQRPMFETHLRRHYPKRIPADQLSALATETAIRMFCHIEMTKSEETLYPDETRQALQQLRDIGNFLKENKGQLANSENFQHAFEKFNNLIPKMRKLKEKEELLALQKKSVEHRYSGDVLYNNLRFYLLKNPL